MDLNMVNSKTKILFLLTNIFLLLTISVALTWLLTTSGVIHLLFLLLTIWFATVSCLIFHYLLWKNLGFLQNITLNKTSNLTFITAIVSYIILFPLIMILTIAFLFIFSTIVFVLIISNFIKKANNRPQPETVEPIIRY